MKIYQLITLLLVLVHSSLLALQLTETNRLTQADSRGAIIYHADTIYDADHHLGLWKSDASFTTYGQTTDSDTAITDIWIDSEVIAGIGTDGLYLYDLNGTLLGNYSGFSGYSVYLQNNYAYITIDSGGIAIIDISDVYHPTYVTTTLLDYQFALIRGNALLGDGQSVGAADTLYATTPDGKLVLISDEKNATLSYQSEIALFGGNPARRIFVADSGRVYVNSNMGELAIVQTDSASMSMSLTGSWSSTESHGSGSNAETAGGLFVVSSGTRTYALLTASDGNDKGFLYWLDITDPSAITLVDSFDDTTVGNYGFGDVWVTDTTAYVASHDGVVRFSLEGLDIAPATISGTVFEDIRGDGLSDGDTVLDDDSGDQVGLAHTTVSLYIDDGNMIADDNDTLFATTNTDILGNGSYRFDNLPQGRYYVVIDSGSMTPSAGIEAGYTVSDIWAEQTYAPAGGMCDDGNGTTFQRTTAGACYGGQTAGTSDSNASLSLAQHIAVIDLNGTNAENVDFGFSFNVVTHSSDNDDDTLNPRSAQGSLRQFIQNANAITGANRMRFVPVTAANESSWWRISLTSALPVISDSDTSISGIAYTVDGTVTDLNSGTLSGLLSVGTGSDGLSSSGDEPVLSPFEKPELELITDTTQPYGLNLAADNISIENIAISGASATATHHAIILVESNSSANGLIINNNLIGIRPDGSIPADKSSAHGIYIAQTASSDFQIIHNYIAATGGSGIILDGSDISLGILRQNEIEACGWNSGSDNGISLTGGVHDMQIYENYIHHNESAAIDSSTSGTGNYWYNNTISSNGYGASASETFGVRFSGAPTDFYQNIVTGNNSSAILIEGSDTDGIHIYHNSFYQNGTIAIDIDTSDDGVNGDGITANNNSKSTTLPNQEMDYPVFTFANLVGSTLTLNGYIGTDYNQNLFASATVEIYKVDDDGDSNGEGSVYLGSCTSDSNGNIDCTIATSYLAAGDSVTAIAIDESGNTSEFGPNFSVSVSVPYACDQNAYVFYSDAEDQPTQVNEIDLLNATQTTLSDNIYPVNINGIGYSVVDNFIWGYDIVNHKVTRTDSNLQTISYDIEGLDDYGFHLGDVSTDGILYLASSYLNTIDGVETDGILRLYRVDVNPDSPTYLQKLSEVTLDDQTLYAADFAFHPNENKIYLVERFSGHIYQIDPDTGHVSDMGTAGLGSNVDSHVQFFDKNGYFYFFKDDVFYRSDFTDPANPVTKAVKFIDMPLPQNGDGARCAYAGMGDKPIIQISDAAVPEGHSGTRDITFIVSSDRPVEQTDGLYIDFVVTDGSATAGSDYNTYSGTVVIPYQERNTTLTLPIVNGDLDIESDEDFFVTLTSDDAFFIDDTGRGVIINDDFNITLNATTVGSPFVDGNLTTQIVNQSFTVMLGAYNETLNQVVNDMNITKIELVSPTGSVYETLFNSIATTGSDGIVLLSLNVPKAYKNTYLNIEGTYMGRTYTGRTHDNFAIRPLAFTMNIPQNNIAGVPFSINLQAIDATYQPATGYNETITSSFDLNFSEQKSALCVTGTMDLDSIAFNDGNASHTTYYTETGMLDFNLSEIAGSEFAIVDADDTPQSQRLITSAQANDINFSIDNLQISNLQLINGATTFTYYAAPADMQQMASRLTLSLKARNALGNITQNYTDGCYAKDVMLGIYFDTNTTATQSHSLAWQEDGNPGHGNDAAVTFNGSVTNQSFIYDISKTAFVQGENNTSVKINFNRSQSVAKEPMRFTVRQVDAVNSDNRSGTQSATLSNDFYYGRVHASDYMAVGNRLDAKLFYEVYCDQCDRNTMFTLASTAESVDQIKWYRFDNYLDGISGFSDVTGTHFNIPVSTGEANETISSISSLGAISNNIDTITFTVPSDMLPFSDRIRYLPKPWLIYKTFPTADNRHSFDIELNSIPATWGGQGQIGGTVDLNVSGRKGILKIDW